MEKQDRDQDESLLKEDEDENQQPSLRTSLME